MVLSGAAIVIGNAVAARRKAEMMVSTLQRFSTATDFNQLFRHVRAEHPGEIKQLDGCTPAYCSYQWRASNRITYHLPFMELNALFQLENNRLGFLYVEYRSPHPTGKSPIVNIQIMSCDSNCDRNFYVHPHGETDEVWNAMVDFNPQATERERQAALSLNLDCFTRATACDEISGMLPSIWKRTTKERIVSRMPSMADASWDRPQG